MSREIKFRVWDTFNRVMVYPKDGESFPAGYVENGKFLDQCIPLQFTGLLDKNNKEIYEKDHLNIWDGEEVKTVIFKDGAFWVDEYHDYGENLLFAWTSGGTTMPQEHMEIIGNIYENPMEGDHE